MTVYIITPTWNSSADFERQLGSVVRNTTVPVWYVVVDNGSRPAERAKIDRVLEYLPGNEVGLAQYITNDQNLGIPVAQNQALDWIETQETPGQYGVVLLDADCEIVRTGWLDDMVAYSMDHMDVGIVGSAKSPRGPSLPVYHHKNGRWYVHDLQQLHDLGEGESVDFACVYWRSELLARGLRFDTGYEIYDGYDQDLCFRVRSWGYRVCQVDAGVHHFGSQSMKTSGYQWHGGGRSEWNNLRAKNVQRFSEMWQPFLADYRDTIEKEKKHLAAMNAKLIAEAGDRKEVPCSLSHSRE